MVCSKCGGTIVGNGYTLVFHCEFADDEKVFESEPDANIILCDYKEEIKKNEKVS